jgi:hypothetical protein
MLKKILKKPAFPIFNIFYSKLTSLLSISSLQKLIIRSSHPSVLFSRDDVLFKRVLKNVKIYGEYGCGKSTVWVLRNTSAQVLSVDTSAYWINEVCKDNVENQARLMIRRIDLGDVGDYGYPIDYSKCDFFNLYTDFLWNQDEKPSVVLIDGRFRVCCFLTSLKFADEGTHIIFDDYMNRPGYHIVEKYVDKVEHCGRQCLFIVPSPQEIDLNSLEKDINNFRYVMD